jgi:membrane protease YdiL (CAAX protease family)
MWVGVNLRAEGSANFPGSLTPVSIAVYLALHAIWAQAVLGAYSFVYLRVLFLLGVAAVLIARGRPSEIRGYFVGRILPQSGIIAFGGMLAVLAVVRLADVALRIWFHAAATYEPGRLLGECVIAPLNEEMVFRGIFLAVLLSQMPGRPGAAIFLGALVYVSVHDLVRQNAFSIELALMLLVLGSLLGWIYFRTRSVLCCILAHSLWNAFAFIPFFRD